MNDLKRKRNYLRDENKKYPVALRELRSDELPRVSAVMDERRPVRVWRSRDFLVQLYNDPSGKLRLSVNRTEIDSLGGWKAGITWDELQRLKAEAGFGAMQAIEFYPPDNAVVNVANIRHLYLMEEPLPFAWKNGECVI